MPRGKLSDAAKVLPPSAQKVWLKAFNESLDKGLPEDEASALAWNAVKRAGYHRLSNGKWGKAMENIFINGDEIKIGIPFMKINTTKRTVEGFATLDNVDKSGEIVDWDATKEAFSMWPGNIREMHQKVAVGKAVEITEKQYTDKDGTTYNGMWIKARISKGAEDTWQKVLDGTLSGFSVGGAIFEKIREMVKFDGVEREVYRITKYGLTELSLVDNPCNQLALISLVKSVDGSLVIENDILDENGEGFEKAHAPGSEDCCEQEINAVMDALKSWRQRELDEEDDYGVITVTRLMSTVRDYMNMEMYEHKDQAAMDAVQPIYEKENNLEGGETMEKSDTVLQENENNDTSSVELSVEHKSLLRKLADFILGDETSSALKQEEVIEKDGGDTPEVNTEEVQTVVSEAVTELNKAVDGKFDEIGESLTKIAEALKSVATAEVVDELKKELEAKVDDALARIDALENSGATKKSADDAGKSGESLEKQDTGLWSDSIVPEFLKKQVG
jgi:cation transport regulator ChaB